MSDMSDTLEGKDPRAPLDPTIRSAIIFTAASGAALAVGAIPFFGPRAGIGVLAGSAMATFNLFILANIGQAFLGQKRSPSAWGAVAIIKLVVLFGGVFLVLKTNVISGLALAAGYSSLVIGLSLNSVWGPKPEEMDSSETSSPNEPKDVIDGRPDPGRDEPPSGLPRS